MIAFQVKICAVNCKFRLLDYMAALQRIVLLLSINAVSKSKLVLMSGAFALANAFHFANGDNLQNLHFDQDKMQNHNHQTV